MLRVRPSLRIGFRPDSETAKGNLLTRDNSQQKLRVLPPAQLKLTLVSVHFLNGHKGRPSSSSELPVCGHWRQLVCKQLPANVWFAFISCCTRKVPSYKTEAAEHEVWLNLEKKGFPRVSVQTNRALCHGGKKQQYSRTVIWERTRGKKLLRNSCSVVWYLFLNNVFMLFSFVIRWYQVQKIQHSKNVDNGDDITVRTPTKMVTVKFYFLHIIIRLYISKIKKKKSNIAALKEWCW